VIDVINSYGFDNVLATKSSAGQFLDNWNSGYTLNGAYLDFCGTFITCESEIAKLFHSNSLTDDFHLCVTFSFRKQSGSLRDAHKMYSERIREMGNSCNYDVEEVYAYPYGKTRWSDTDTRRYTAFGMIFIAFRVSARYFVYESVTNLGNDSCLVKWKGYDVPTLEPASNFILV